MKHLHSKKTHFPRFDKIPVIQPIAEVYGEGDERQEIGSPVESKIVRVVSLSATEISKIKKNTDLQGPDNFT